MQKHIISLLFLLVLLGVLLAGCSDPSVAGNSGSFTYVPDAASVQDLPKPVPYPLFLTQENQAQGVVS